MSVVAKFTVDYFQDNHHTRYPHKNDRGNVDYLRPEVEHMRTVHLTPVYSDDPDSENRKFWEASPTGKIELGLINSEVWHHFELGKEYYITFEKAD